MDIIDEFNQVHNYTVLDIETTGINCKTDDITEISALKIRNDEIADSFSKLVYTDIIISPFIISLTGINNEMLNGADSVSTVLCELFDFIENDIIVGHNISFDMRFINHQSQLNFGSYQYCNTLDTLQLAKKALPELSSHKLTYLKEYFSIEGTSHRALADCETTYRLIECIKQKVNS